MMLGKRARPEMKRTTSMKEFTLDLSCGAEGARQPLDPRNGSVDQPFLASSSSSSSSAAEASPRTQRLNPAGMVQTAHFLRVCSLCKRRLVHYRDIYMYRGDSAFCSVECRQQQMTQDERKENCALASKKEAAGSSAAGSQVSATS